MRLYGRFYDVPVSIGNDWNGPVSGATKLPVAGDLRHEQAEQRERGIGSMKPAAKLRSGGTNAGGAHWRGTTTCVMDSPARGQSLSHAPMRSTASRICAAAPA
jgi:hypothetical protein